MYWLLWSKSSTNSKQNTTKILRTCVYKAHYHCRTLQLIYKVIFQKDTSKLQLMSDSKERKNLLPCWNNFYIQLFSSSVTLCKYENISILISIRVSSQSFVCNYELWEQKNQFLEHIWSNVSSFRRKTVLNNDTVLYHIYFCIIMTYNKKNLSLALNIKWIYNSIHNDFKYFSIYRMNL